MIDSIPPVSALSGTTPALSANPVVPSAAASFSSYLADAATQTVDTVRAAEQAMIGGLSGTAGPQDVVDAVIAAETSVQTVVAVRDKVISAYNDILRMPI